VSEDRTTRTEQPKIARSGQQGKDNLDRTAGTGQPRQDMPVKMSRDETARAGQLGQDSWIVQLVQDSQDMTKWTGSNDRTSG
jgi:hypothetical protein